MYFNSTLNPFLYRWKVREAKQAVKQTIWQELYFLWTWMYFLGVVRLVLMRNLKGKGKEDEMKKTGFFSIYCVLYALVFA